MRCFVIAWTVLLACISPAFPQGWEWLNPLPQGNTLIDVEFLGQNALLGTSYSGTAIASTDGGTTWTLRNNGEAPFPSELEFASVTEGWGYVSVYAQFSDSLKNAILHTVDGGQTWQPQYHNPMVEIDDISFPSLQVGWAIGHTDPGYQLVMLNTADGGLTWAEQVSDTAGWNGQVFFLNELEGWISIHDWILHTTDGGIGWEWQPAEYRMHHDMIFTDSQNGWGVGLDVYHTTNGGQTWIPQSMPGISSITVTGPGQVWTAGGAGRVYHSINDGQSWAMTLLDTLNNLRKVTFADAQHGWICGEFGAVFQTVNGGSNWTRRCGNSGAEIDNYCVDFADLQNGWMGGFAWQGGSPLLHTTNGGVDWSVQYFDSMGYFMDIAALSASNVWAVGRHVLHTTNGGTEWDVVDIGGYSPVQEIVCITEDIIWLASGWDWGKRVHRSTDGGETWEMHQTDLGAKFSGMTAGDVNNVWITTWADFLDEGTVVHSSDGGETWELQADSLGYLDGMFFLDAQHGWAGAWCGIVRSTDGGDHWTLACPDTYIWVEQMEFSDLLNGWMINYNDAYRTTDGGTTWQLFDPFVDTHVTDIDFVDMNHAWITGWDGTLLRFDGTIFDTPEPPAPTPSALVLHPAYPNPFNPATAHALELPVAGRVRVEIFDITGRLVQTLTDQVYAAGQHTIRFSADELASGVYFARASSGSLYAVQKLMLIR